MEEVITLSQKQSDAWHFLEDKETTEVFYGGGAGGGKSWLGCLWHILRRINYPESRGLIGRSKLSNLKLSTIVTFFEVCKTLGYKSGVDFVYNSQDHFVKWKNGSVTIFKDLFLYPSDPDFTSLGSTEFTDVFIDEAPEITLKAFEIVNSRIRWKLHEYGLTPKTLLTGNPSPGWVRQRFIKDNNGNQVQLKNYQKYVRALVTDNPNKEFVQLYTEQLNKLSSEYDRKRLLEGDWDVKPKTGEEFFHSFNRFNHVSRVEFIPNLPVHLTFDFNARPYMTLVCCQVESIENTMRVRVFREYCLKSPLNNSTSVCEAFLRDYGHYNPSVFYYGDATGKNAIPGKGNDYAFRDIEIALRSVLNNNSDRVSRRNRNPLKRRDFINECLQKKHNIEIIIDESCYECINDFENLQTGINGKDKPKVDGVEIMGHTSDAFEYFITEIFSGLVDR
jgi:phage terminase large subunit